VRAISAGEIRSLILARLNDRLKQRGVEPKDVSDDVDLLAEGIIDSMGILELIMAIEEHFGIKVDFEGLQPEQLTVIGSFSRYIEQKYALSNSSSV
jgi:acyl carrier protein